MIDRVREHLGGIIHRLADLLHRLTARLADLLHRLVPERWVRRVKLFWHEWQSDRVPDLAAEVAFFAILSLVPAFLAIASVLGFLADIAGETVAADVERTVLDFLRNMLTDEADTTIEAVSSLFREASPGLLTASLLAALWTLSRGFAALVRALDVVYDLDEHRSWLRIRGTALTLAVGSTFSGTLMLAMLVIGPLFGSGRDVADIIGLGDAFVAFWDLMRIPMALVIMTLWSATVLHHAPDHSTPWRWDLPGACVTTVLWLAFSGALRLYLGFAPSTNQVFGILGGILTVMLWFWLLALAVLVGGEWNQILADERRQSSPDSVSPTDRPSDVASSDGPDVQSNDGPDVQSNNGPDVQSNDGPDVQSDVADR